jgi:tetratricopeptide (TPR) repeat protein
VQRYLDDEPVQACPPSVGYKVRKFVRRHRAAVLIAACVVLGATVFGVTVTWLQRQQSSLQKQIEGEVNLALGQADLLEKQTKWSEARDAVKRAQGLLGKGTANEALQQRVQERLTDLVLAAELEQIFTDRMLSLAEIWWGELSNPGIDKRYAEAFQNAGIDVQTLSVEEAAEKIGQRGIRAEIAAALDNWTVVRAYSVGFRNKEQDQVWKKLQELATVVDPEPYRVKLRKVEREFDDPQKLLDSPELLEQPMPVIMSLALPVLKAERREGRYEKVLRKLHQRHPQDFWVNFELGTDSSHPVDAVRFGMAALAIRPEVAAVHLQLGIALQKLGRLDDAIAAFQQARRLNEGFAETHQYLGEALAAKQRWDEAIVCFKQAARLATIDFGGPQRVIHIYNNLGLALQKRGKLDEAIAALHESLKIRPDNAETHYYLGRVLSLKGNPEEARAAFQRVLTLAPNNANAQNDVAWFWATGPVKDRDPERAVAAAKRAVQLVPRNGNCWNTLGVAHYRNGEWQESIAALMKSVQLRQGGDGSDFFFLAMAHWQLGEKDKARTWYDQAVAWMNKNKPSGDELKRFHVEATALLGQAKTSEKTKKNE